MYAFADVRPETGEVYLNDTRAYSQAQYPSGSRSEAGENLDGSLKQLYTLKKANRNLKVLLSIGGWTYSANITKPASTPQGRQEFAKSAVTLLKDLGFDGIDIDWEYPSSPREGEDLVALLAACREELDLYASSLPETPHFTLTIASPAGPSNFPNLPFEKIDPFLDFWNLMSYDFAGSWDQVSGHQANLYPSTASSQANQLSVDGAVQHYMSKGVPPAKIVIGMPLYGRAFLDTDGPGSPYHGVGRGSWEDGVWDSKVSISTPVS
jgi:chitinase